MDQCTDGTFQATGQKFFNCPHGMGLYYPLQNVKPDQRWAPQVAADGNRKNILTISFPLIYKWPYSFEESA